MHVAMLSFLLLYVVTLVHGLRLGFSAGFRGSVLLTSIPAAA